MVKTGLAFESIGDDAPRESEEREPTHALDEAEIEPAVVHAGLGKNAERAAVVATIAEEDKFRAVSFGPGGDRDLRMPFAHRANARPEVGERAKFLFQRPAHEFHRARVEREYAPLYEHTGLGLTTWSPLASGLLTGKYASGVPAGSRGAMDNMAFLRDGLTDRAKNAAVQKLQLIADEWGGSVAQLALAWAAKNPRVSSVITGASKLSQLQSNLGALALLDKLTPAVLKRIDGVTKSLAD